MGKTFKLRGKKLTPHKKAQSMRGEAWDARKERIRWQGTLVERR